MNLGTTHSARRGDLDLLIVGAGPAGLACAIATASRGLKVTVVDAMRAGIDKACGEGLMPDALTALAALGFDPGNDLSSIETAPLGGIRFLCEQTGSLPMITTEAAFPSGPGRGIRRTVLHQFLLERAISLGVRFEWETVARGITQDEDSVQLHTNRQSLTARYLVGADGHQSRVAASANLEEASVYSRRIGLRQHYAVTPWTNFVEVYWSNRGQAYVTPISPATVCVAFISNRRFSSPTEALTHFPGLQRHIASVTAAPQPIGAPRGAITIGRSLRRVRSGNIALVGDASGSVDAVTGEGMALGFRQAAALASALAADDLSTYQSAHRNIQRIPTLMSRSLLLMDRYPRLCARTLNTFERNPKLFARLLQMHIGHAPVQFFGRDGLLATGLHLLSI